MSEIQNNYGVALYYPYINVRDIDWLKCALLYWDKIRCIVPTDETNHQSIKDDVTVLIEPVKTAEDCLNPHVKYLCDNGVVEPTSPKDYINAAVETFRNRISRYKDRWSELDIVLKKYSQDTRHDLQDMSIHGSKILKGTFEDMGIKLTVGGGDFYHAQSYVVALYISVLASEMSKRINAPMLTDTPGLAGLSQLILWSDEAIPHGTEPESFLLQLGIAYPSAKELRDLTFANLLEYRQKRNSERRRFREAVEEIRSTVQGLKDPNNLADYLSDKKQKIEEVIDDQRKTLNEIGIKDFASSIKAAWPLMIGLPIGAIAGPAVGIFGAIGLASISIAYSKAGISQEKRKAIKECPWHYVINIEEEQSSSS